MTETDIRSNSPLPPIGMVSTHGYVAAEPPLGKADTGGQVVYVLELSKKLAQLGFEVDIWTRRLEDQPEIDVVNERVRVLCLPSGGPNFLDKEYLVRRLFHPCLPRTRRRPAESRRGLLLGRVPLIRGFGRRQGDQGDERDAEPREQQPDRRTGGFLVGEQ